MKKLVNPGVDPELVDLFESIFRQSRPASGPETPSFDSELWRTLEEAGLTQLTEAEGGTWREAAALMRTASASGIALPLAENDVLAGWLAQESGMERGTGIRVAAAIDADGTAPDVAWAPLAGAFLILGGTGDGTWASLASPADVTLTPGTDLAGVPTATLQVVSSTLERHALKPGAAEEYEVRGKLARCVQSTGAMHTATALAVAYATERRQFGRPLAKFQAVQNMLADAAGELQVAVAATDVAVSVMADEVSADRRRIAVAIAASVVGHAASVIVRNTHQVFGAIGTTREHDLRLYTSPLLAWRAQFGSVEKWDRYIAERCRLDAAGAWNVIVPLSEASR